MQRKWQVLAVTSAGVFMSFLDATVVNMAFPSVQRTFADASLGTLSWVLNAYTVVFAALLIPAGRAGDRFGRRRLYLAGLLTFVAASGICIAARSPGGLILGRAVQAVGAAMLVPNSLGLLLPEFERDRQATAAAMWGAVGGMAAALGPVLGGMILQSSSWRWIFVLNLPVGLAAALAGARFLPERRDANAVQVGDVLAIALLALGVGATALAIVHGPTWGWGSTRVMTTFTVAAAALASFAWRCRSSSAAAEEVALFRIPSFRLANAGFFFFAFGFFAVLLANVLFLITVWGYSSIETGLALTPGALLGMLVAIPAGMACDRRGPRGVAVTGGIVFGLACAAYALYVGPTPEFVSVWLGPNLLLGVGSALVFAGLGSAAIRELPVEHFSMGAALSASCRQIGGVLGVAIVVAVLGTTLSGDVLDRFHIAWTLMGVAGLASAFMAFAMRTGGSTR
jgi:EmrB/QacA subfamily drug resistance transporter